MEKRFSKLAKRTLLAAFVACVAWAFFAYRSMDATIRNAYAQWWVADMVTLHLEANDESWPNSWDELRDDYETSVKTSGRPWSFEELNQRVVVNWNVDTTKLKKIVADGLDFRVIWLRDGTTSYWKSSEANQIIRDYLRLKMKEQPADALVPTNIDSSK